MTTDALIIKGDCLKVMAGLPEASIDAIVTDPPYGLSFMGKDWDKGVPGESFWREALRVAKPGCHILAAGGSRTYHRLTCAIEDAGWEIRDCIIWMYGSGFPKSLDVSKAIDREAGAEREVVVGKRWEANRKPGTKEAGRYGEYGPDDGLVTAPATDAARQWQGWGTALKPAFEPFILARKPLDGTVANNVQRYGCGALNVDGCRVEMNGETIERKSRYTGHLTNCHIEMRPWMIQKFEAGEPLKNDFVNFAGRWPANVIHDGSDEAVGVFPDDNSRFFYCAKASPSERDEGCEGLPQVVRACGPEGHTKNATAKTGELQRLPRGNHHPTVKPVDLMKYLCRLITPPGGLILDPFCGSGSTGVAAMREGFNFIGIELNNDYAEIARRRINHERNKTPLFSNVI